MIEELFKQFLEHAKTLKAAIVFLWRRMGALRLPQVAGSLSYTTVLSLVPLLVIVLSILTILPQFQGFQKEIQNSNLKNITNSNDRSGYLIYQANKRIQL